MTKQQQKQIDKLYEEEQKKFVEWKRKENPKREKELLDRFGEDRLQRLRKSLDYIQNNEFVHESLQMLILKGNTRRISIFRRRR